jgi:hypothetical protein
MCDYSLHDVASRPAKVGDKLVSTQFPNAITRGFSDPSQPRVAVCLLPGTELAFEKEVECDASFRFLPTRKSTHKVARFRQVNLSRPAAHHDALEFPDGKIAARASTRPCCNCQAADGPPVDKTNAKRKKTRRSSPDTRLSWGRGNIRESHRAAGGPQKILCFDTSVARSTSSGRRSVTRGVSGLPISVRACR